MNTEFWTASFVCFFGAAVLSGLAAVCRYLDRKNRKYQGEAQGHVVEVATEPALKEENRTEFHNRQFAVIEFFAGGHPVKVRSPSTLYPCPYYVGQRFQLCYDPEDPGKYEILTDRRWNVLSLLAGGLSLALVAAGCALFLLFAQRVEL